MIGLTVVALLASYYLWQYNTDPAVTLNLALPYLRDWYYYSLIACQSVIWICFLVVFLAFFFMRKSGVFRNAMALFVAGIISAAYGALFYINSENLMKYKDNLENIPNSTLYLMLAVLPLVIYLGIGSVSRLITLKIDNLSDKIEKYKRS